MSRYSYFNLYRLFRGTVMVRTSPTSNQRGTGSRCSIGYCLRTLPISQVLQLIWRSGTLRFRVRVSIIQMSRTDLTTSWWRHEMETFSALLAICAGNSSVTGEFPTQRPVARSFDVFFYLRLNKRLSKQSWGWWFETLSGSLWRHCNVTELPGSSSSRDFRATCAI